jgi:hypothetical protein
VNLLSLQTEFEDWYHGKCFEQMLYFMKAVSNLLCTTFEVMLMLTASQKLQNQNTSEKNEAKQLMNISKTYPKNLVVD